MGKGWGALGSDDLKFLFAWSWQMQQTLEQDRLLHRITSQIRQSLNLEEILNTAATEVRLFLGTDRVKIYQFYADGHGQVIAESIHQDRLPSLLGLHFPADDIPPQARELFLSARQRSIVDLETQQIGLSYPEQEIPDVRYRPVDPCHVEYLRAMGVQSSVVVPILQAEQLWGLLVSHNVKPRSVTEAELQFLQSVVNQLEIAITQAILVKKIQQQVEHETKVNRISRLLHADPRIQLQHALEETTTVLQGTASRLYLLKGNEAPEVYTSGEQPALLDGNRPLEQHYLWQSYLRGDSTQTAWAVKDLYQEPAFRTLTSIFQATSIRGLLVIPLHYGQQCLGCLTIFRPAIETETLWAGQFDPDRRQTMPRDSFLAWRELKGGQTMPWVEADLKLAQALGEHFSMAVQQYHLYHQVQTLNTGLEQQVQERTATLHQAIDRQKALAVGREAEAGADSPRNHGEKPQGTAAVFGSRRPHRRTCLPQTRFDPSTHSPIHSSTPTHRRHQTHPVHPLPRRSTHQRTGSHQRTGDQKRL
ncbi:GAF domain-containing protein [Leptolyngbya sp. 7M]|uniref:GAF domain-containing protein n=1 Tax=Leptolyngbya sp. 7M TaxID=2812896 RepID=UPI001B8AF23B|nr:GAF domain-containing protein [Leptolyngbya sp. 7M]QYO63564.1 GAF domain-containing protein [Leptolyngbya sp. 7M]